MPTASVIVEIDPCEKLATYMETAAHEEGATLDEYFLRLANAYLESRTTISEKVEVHAPD